MLVFVVSLWVWIYWGLPRVPDAETIWSLNRQESVRFVDRDGETLGVRGPYYGARVHLAEIPDYVPQSLPRDRGIAASTNMKASTASACCAPCCQPSAPVKRAQAARRRRQLARNLFSRRARR